MTGALLLFLLPMAYSPGPGNLLFAANAARFGFRASLPALAGYHLATFAVTWAAAMGFTTGLHANEALARAVRLAGAAYVLWLAWKLWHAGESHTVAAKPMGFAGGAALLILNPKAWLIIALLLSQFGAWFTPARLSMIFTLNNLIAFALWMLAGRALMRLFTRPDAAQQMNRLFAALLGIVAIWMALA